VARDAREVIVSDDADKAEEDLRPDFMKRPPTPGEVAFAGLVAWLLGGLLTAVVGYLTWRGFMVMWDWESLSGRPLGRAEIIPFQDVVNAFFTVVVLVIVGRVGFVMLCQWLNWALTTDPGKPDADDRDDWP
jgi:hypothetical protein